MEGVNRKGEEGKDAACQEYGRLAGWKEEWRGELQSGEITRNEQEKERRKEPIWERCAERENKLNCSIGKGDGGENNVKGKEKKT